MNIPVSREELSSLLSVTYAEIDRLWGSGRLKRTVACMYRPSLVHSSPFDLLEYWLSSDAAKYRLSREDAALWVFCLAEAVEDDDFRTSSFLGKLRSLRKVAEDEGLIENATEATQITVSLVCKYEETLEIIKRNDFLPKAV